MGSNSRGDAGAHFWHIDTPFFRHVNILERIRPLIPNEETDVPVLSSSWVQEIY
jgi:hypothetical protein